MWLKVKKGTACFANLAGHRINAENNFLPVTRHSWLHMMTDGEIISTYTSSRIKAWKKTGMELSSFYTIAIRLIEHRLIMESKNEQERLQNKTIEEKTSIGNALNHLSSLFISGSKADYSSVVTPDALLTACKWIGINMQIPITAPPDLENNQIMSKPKLEQITRASQIRTRQVLLQVNWWKKDSGPILGQIEDSKKPVALIPSTVGRYHLADPVDLSFTPVTSEVAEKLSPFAYNLYPSFPQKSLHGADILKFGLKDCKTDGVMLILFGITGGLLSLLTPFMTGYLFDIIIPEASEQLLIHLALALISVAITVGILNFVRGIAYVRIESKMNKHIQAAIWDRLLSLPFLRFNNYQKT